MVLTNAPIFRRLGPTLVGPAGRFVTIAAVAVSLNACAIPPIVSIAKFATDGILLVTTGKSSTDHGLSAATGRDCATLRVLDGEDVCREEVLAQAESVPAEVRVGRAKIAGLAATPLGAEGTGAALDVAFREYSSDGGAAPAGLRPSHPPVMVVADLPRPVQSAASIRYARVEPAGFRLASAQRSAPTHAGLIKASLPSGPVFKVAVRAKDVPAAGKPSLPEAGQAKAPAHAGPQKVEAGEDKGAIARLTRLLRQALGMGQPG